MSELRLNTDGHIIKFGADNDVSLTHVADTGLLLNSTMQLQFNDASQNINAPSATILDINATDEIELNATAVDLNGTLDVSGTLTQTGVATFTARDIHSSGITIANAGQIGSVGDADSMAIASNGVVTFTQAPVFPDGSLAVADLDIDGATDIGAAVVDADLFIIDDGAGGANRKVTASRIKTYAGGAAVMNDLTDVAMDITNFVDSIVIQTDSNGSAPTTGTLSGATGNVGIGKDVFKTLTSGTQNVVFGYNAGDAITTGADNIVLGAHAGTDLNTGTNNTFVGRGAGGSITSGSSNVSIGHNAYNGCDGEDKNISIGQDALGGGISGGEFNTAVGIEAGLVVTSGDENTLFGYQAGKGILAGANNTCLGRNAGDAITTGSNNICIGSGSDPAVDSQSNGIALGSVTAASDDFSFGRSSNVVTNDFDADADWSRSSDIRLKKNIESTTLGLDFINDLRPVKFQWKPSYEVPKEMKTEYNVENQKNLDYVSHGFIAQEVKEAIDKHGDTTFGGWHMDKVDNETQRVKKNMFIMPLIKAVQELTAKVKELEAK